MKTIKSFRARPYVPRKLLLKIEKAIQAGEEIEVIDMDTEEDITGIILLNLVLQKEKGKSPPPTKKLLKRIIREAGTYSQFIISQLS